MKSLECPVLLPKEGQIIFFQWGLSDASLLVKSETVGYFKIEVVVVTHWAKRKEAWTTHPYWHPLSFLPVTTGHTHGIVLPVGRNVGEGKWR